MSGKTIVKIWLIYLLFVVAGQAGAAETTAGLAQFREGVSAFRAGNYELALQRFEASQQQGNQDPRLIYNLGVTRFKLKQLDAAEQNFLALTKHAEWVDIARLNLGLIARERGEPQAAERWFTMVYRSGTNAKLIHLAGEELRKMNVPLDAAGSRRADKPWFTLLNLGGGYDDNAIAFPDNLQTRSSQGEDWYVDFLAYGQTYLTGDMGDGIRLDGSLYSKQYDDLDIVDVNSLNTGLIRESRYGDWNVEYGARAGYTQVDGDKLGIQMQGELGIARSIGSNEYSARYRPVYHDSGDNYAHLGGWEHRLELRWRRYLETLRLTARYRLEINSRDDLQTDDMFISYSPLNNGISLQADWYVAPDWTVIGGASYLNSRYADENRMTDIDGVFKTEKRKADIVELWLTGQYELTSAWRLIAEYRYKNNDDNFELYKYERNEIKLAVEFVY